MRDKQFEHLLTYVDGTRAILENKVQGADVTNALLNLDAMRSILEDLRDSQETASTPSTRAATMADTFQPGDSTKLMCDVTLYTPLPTDGTYAVFGPRFNKGTVVTVLKRPEAKTFLFPSTNPSSGFVKGSFESMTFTKVLCLVPDERAGGGLQVHVGWVPSDKLEKIS